jgi:hypothetical protein
VCCCCPCCCCRYDALAGELSALQARWEAREPRDEDVALIRSLTQRVAELEELVGGGWMNLVELSKPGNLVGSCRELTG